jgi:diphthamide biosynthesis protein 2
MCAVYCCLLCCQVHYGYASLHPVSRTPALCVLPKQQLNVQTISTWLVQQLSELHAQVQSSCTQDAAQDSQQQQQQQQQQSPVCVICSDQSYLHQLPDLQQAVLQAYSGPLQLVFAQSAATELWPQGHPAAADDDDGGGGGGGGGGGTAAAAADTPVPIGGLLWQLPSSSPDSQPSSSSTPQHTCSGLPDLMVWLGPPSSSALTHLQLSFASCRWLLLDPETQGIAEGLSPGLDRVLKRRYYLVERARGAAMVGLLVGTLGAAGYRTALEQLRRLAGKVGFGHCQQSPAKPWCCVCVCTACACQVGCCLGSNPGRFCDDSF